MRWDAFCVSNPLATPFPGHICTRHFHHPSSAFRHRFSPSFHPPQKALPSTNEKLEAYLGLRLRVHDASRRDVSSPQGTRGTGGRSREGDRLHGSGHIYVRVSCVFMRIARAREFLLSHLLEMVQFFSLFFFSLWLLSSHPPPEFFLRLLKGRFSSFLNFRVSEIQKKIDWNNEKSSSGIK